MRLHFRGSLQKQNTGGNEVDGEQKGDSCDEIVRQVKE